MHVDLPTLKYSEREHVEKRMALPAIQTVMMALIRQKIKKKKKKKTALVNDPDVSIVFSRPRLTCGMRFCLIYWVDVAKTPGYFQIALLYSFHIRLLGLTFVCVS